LAAYRDRRCRKKDEEIAKALEGNYLKEHIFALKQALEAHEFFHQQILECEKSIEETLYLLNQTSLENEVEAEAPQVAEQSKKKGKKKTVFNRSPYYFDASRAIQKVIGINLLDIPGMDGNTMIKILSEIGTDMNRWKSAKHFASWLGLCPANKISGGKILSSRTKRTKNKANQALKVAANTLYHSKTALGDFFR